VKALVMTFVRLHLEHLQFLTNSGIKSDPRLCSLFGGVMPMLLCDLHVHTIKKQVSSKVD